MVLALDDRWVWDSWYVSDGGLTHAFFLQADKSIGDPEQRHWNVSYGHATSADLINWDHLGTCFAPAEQPAWDDFTTWTGSVIQDDDGIWHLFYTGTSHADAGKHQRIGHAVSNDLHSWERVGSGLILDRDDRYEEFEDGRWHDRAFRDPWVMRDPEGEGWLMYFTARNANAGLQLEAGAIGFATSDNLYDWALQDPIHTGYFGELEVPQVFERGGTWYCLFCVAGKFFADSAREIVGSAETGTHYLIAQSPKGPWKLGPGPMLDSQHSGQRYAARVVEHDNKMKLMGFLMHDPDTGAFPGIISDPDEVVRLNDGRLVLKSASEGGN